jgi:hypothetical protein
MAAMVVAFPPSTGAVSDKEIKKPGLEPKFPLHIIAALEPKLPRGWEDKL